MRKGTAILIGFNCRFWAMQNSNENVYMCAMSGKTEIDRERERERERMKHRNVECSSHVNQLKLRPKSNQTENPKSKHFCDWKCVWKCV